MNRPLLSGFLIFIFFSIGYSQKIKYKDLFVLLNARQFAEAEGFLKKYLKDNDDNPNAYLFMGMIYQDKSAKLDVLKQTELKIKQIDSAVYFYNLASKGMTEKEVRKNDEYYQMYNRRDQRTGEFGVKLSDVTLDIETRMQIKEKIPLFKALKSQFLAAEKYYDNSQKLFLEIQKSYASQKEFYLRADDKLLADLSHLAKLYDSCHINFNDYKATSQTIGKTGYNQDLDPTEINDFKKDGSTPSDFYHDDLKVWDYKRWALSSLEIIEKEINPMKDQLVALDVEINQVQQKLKKDSTSVKEDIALIRSKINFPALRKIDAQPLPLKVFEMKVSELDYGSLIVEHRSIRDSSSVLLQTKAIKGELTLAQKMDTLSTALTKVNLENESENYKHFVTTAYGTASVLKNLISGTKEFADREVLRKENELKKKNESLRWIISGADSIPLFTEVSSSSRFKPLLLKEEKFTAGLHFPDSLATGYFYTISPSRKPDVKATFTVDQHVFKKRNLPFIKALSASDEKGLVYFIVIYSEAKIKEKFPATISKIYRTDGLAWAINFTFDQLPEEIVYSHETSELSVKTRSASGDLIAVIFDKNGKLVK